MLTKIIKILSKITAIGCLIPLAFIAICIALSFFIRLYLEFSNF